MNESGDPSGKVKVVDRRRFTVEGDVRPDWEEVAPPSSSADEVATPARDEPDGAATEEPPPRPAGAENSGQGSSQLFLELVGSLSQQAEIMITGAQGLPAQPSQAQRIIDYLGVLETKTRGNLSAEEAQILSTLVFQLRSLYVQSQTGT